MEMKSRVPWRDAYLMINFRSHACSLRPRLNRTILNSVRKIIERETCVDLLSEIFSLETHPSDQEEGDGVLSKKFYS